ncbi:hypothetical protein DUI87_27045 [Hirundo rustica rustica]|uniref:Uncharacterized protein n=1 Tax=Hirundo rustica rustica TaxID=333673 RepID=A0A3M0J6P4_HIRRU|nr:hypothetical protein DUI87_27045 [Hirundo rustica rustica]
MNLQLLPQSREEQGQWWLGETLGKGLQHQDTGNVLMLLGGKGRGLHSMILLPPSQLSLGVSSSERREEKRREEKRREEKRREEKRREEKRREEKRREEKREKRRED